MEERTGPWRSAFFASVVDSIDGRFFYGHCYRVRIAWFVPQTESEYLPNDRPPEACSCWFDRPGIVGFCRRLFCDARARKRLLRTIFDPGASLRKSWGCRCGGVDSTAKVEATSERGAPFQWCPHDTGFFCLVALVSYCSLAPPVY